MKKSMMIALSLGFALSASHAHAATVEVPGDVPSINVALGIAGPGGTVRLSAGTYHEAVVFPFDDQTLEGIGNAVIEPLGTTGVFVPAGVSRARIEGVRVRNCSTGFHLMGDGAVVEDCRVRNASVYGVVVEAADSARVERTKIKNVEFQGVIVLGGSRCVVERCLVNGAGRQGIFVSGSFHSVLDNSIKNITEEGIQVGSVTAVAASCLIQGNSVRNTGFDGIECEREADRCTVADNTVRAAGRDGIDIRWLSDDNVVTGNTVQASGDNGLEIDGLNCTVSLNKVKFAGGDGMAFQSSGDNGYVYRNNVKRSLGDGFDIYGSANNFTDNKAKHSGGFDRNSHVPLASNTWLDNRFPTSNL